MSGRSPTFFFLREMSLIRKETETRIWEITEPAVVAAGMEMVCVECLRMKTRWLVRIYIDKPGGVTIDDCARISEEVGDLLAVHDVPHEAYTLEISSPGLDRPLVKDDDFIRFRGRRVAVQTEYKIDGSRNFKGILKDFLIDGDGGKTILLDREGKSFAIPRAAVAKARLVYVWDNEEQ